jgi:hypothetical protein
VLKVLEKSTAIPLLTLRAGVVHKKGETYLKRIGSDSEHDNSLLARRGTNFEPVWKLSASSLNASDDQLINKLPSGSF